MIKITQLALLGGFLLFGGTLLKAETFSDQDVRCLATAIYYESSGESINGQYAIGEIILNRLHNRVASSVCGVVNQKNGKHYQFGFKARKIKGIPKSKLNYFLCVARTVLNQEDSIRLPYNVMYFNNIRFKSNKYRLYCKIGHQYFFSRT